MRTLLLIVFVTRTQIQSSAGPFENLGFDEAQTNNIQTIQLGGPNDKICRGLTKEMLPYWELYRGTTLETNTGLNMLLPGTSTGWATLINEPEKSMIPVEGIYSLLLTPCYDIRGDMSYIPMSLIQIGLIPSEARTVHFMNFGSTFELRLNGSLVPLVYIDRGFNPVNPQLRWADGIGEISAYAGQEVEMKFTSLRTTLSVYNGIDSIYFSIEPIPEPAGMVLFSLGGLLLASKRWRMGA